LWGTTPGTGKSFLAEVLDRLLGRHNCEWLTQEILASGFTGWAMRSKLVVIEELRSLDRKQIQNTLHPWITQDRISVHDKNVKAFRMLNLIAWLLMSNRGDFPLDNGDRRYLIAEAVRRVMTADYYRRLYAMLDDSATLAALHHKLLNFDLKGYSITDQAPMTAAKRTMHIEGDNAWARWMVENKGTWPLGSVVVVDKVIEAAPPRLTKGNADIDKLVRNALRDHFGAVQYNSQVRIEGKGGPKPRPWLTGDLAKRADKLTPSQVAAIYKREAAAARGDGAKDAAALGLDD
jgi:hypothetical protein